MSGKTIESFQIRVYMNARELGLTQVDSATIAEFLERTGQRIEAGTHQPKRGQVQNFIRFGLLASLGEAQSAYPDPLWLVRISRFSEMDPES